MIKFALGTGLGLLVGGVLGAMWTKKRADELARAQYGAPIDWTRIATPVVPSMPAPPLPAPTAVDQTPAATSPSNTTVN